MKRKQPKSPKVEPHVFDQTNGVVDLGSNSERSEANGERDRAVSGIAMLSTQKP